MRRMRAEPVPKRELRPKPASPAAAAARPRYPSRAFSASCGPARIARAKARSSNRRAKNAAVPGRVEKERTIEIKIPAGVETGSRLRVTGEGEAGVNGGPSGDLFVVIHVREHESFERQGANLYSAVPVTFAQAALGAEIKVKTLDGEEDLKGSAGNTDRYSFSCQRQRECQISAAAATAIFLSR